MDLFNFARFLHIFTWTRVLLLFISSFFVVGISYIFRSLTKTWFYTEINLFPEEIDLLVQLIIWGLTFILLINLLNCHKYIVPLVRRFLNQWDDYSISFDRDEERFEKEWKLQGNPILVQDGLVVTNTNSGVLLNPKRLWRGRVWKNFEAIINVNFKKQKELINRQFYEDKNRKIKERDVTHTHKQLLGIIFRAQNLDSYFLLEVWKIEKRIVMRPHVRVEGNWDAPILNPDANSYALNSNSNEISLKLNVEGDEVTLLINNDTKRPLIWILPTDYEINLVQHSKPEQKDLKQTNVRYIPFKSRAGMFGFRNYGDEVAIVKNLTIKSINR